MFHFSSFTCLHRDDYTQIYRDSIDVTFTSSGFIDNHNEKINFLKNAKERMTTNVWVIMADIKSVYIF